MALFAISDLHLSYGAFKPMDIFGNNWTGYMDKIKYNWEKTVSCDDHVIIPGDISWATYLEDAIPDFLFLEKLPGKKYILKGNHDYWWTTLNKLREGMKAADVSSVEFIQNDFRVFGKQIVCGTRGWKSPGEEDFSEEDMKIYKRELQRLETALRKADETAQKIDGAEIIVALHFPPFNKKREPGEFVQLMMKYHVARCIYGHMHAERLLNAFNGFIGGIGFKLISADYTDFTPVRLA